MADAFPIARGRTRFATAAIAVAATMWVACDAGPKRTKLFAASSLSNVVDHWNVMRKEQGLRPARANLAGSNVLRTQIESGAPADVFISANKAHVLALQHRGLVRETFELSTADVVVVTPRDSKFSSIESLNGAERIVIASGEVPLGEYTEQLLRCLGEEFGAQWRQAVDARVVSRELNARQVRAKVSMREADAAVVYRPDVDNTTMLELVPPPACTTRASYVVALLSSNREYYDFLKSHGASEMSEFGFVSVVE